MNAKIESITQPSGPDMSCIKGGKSGGAPALIKSLEEAVLSIDWEVNPENIEKLTAEIKKLERLWKKNSVALSLLRILAALGGYIGKGKAAAHVDAFKLLYSVFRGLERIMLSQGMSEKLKMKIVQGELQKYNNLRKQIKKRNITATALKSRAKAPVSGKVQQVPASGAQTKLCDEKCDGPIPALAEVSIPEESVSKSLVKGTDADTEIEQRLATFFGETPGEQPESEGDSEDNSVVVPLQLQSRKGNQESDERQAGAREEKTGTYGEKPTDVLQDLYSPQQTKPADNLLLDMHLVGFKKNDQPERNPEDDALRLASNSDLEGLQKVLSQNSLNLDGEDLAIVRTFAENLRENCQSTPAAKLLVTMLDSVIGSIQQIDSEKVKNYAVKMLQSLGKALARSWQSSDESASDLAWLYSILHKYVAYQGAVGACYRSMLTENQGGFKPKVVRMHTPGNAKNKSQ